mmetsp:Transcript_114266/g.318106  ORF Transcript_114266/g.318106 Transcript_114266/m.318106 type:complete len:330 (-) Transcript_114266:21-1010(-)
MQDSDHAKAGERKHRWRKDRRDAPEQPPPPLVQASPSPLTENQAAAHAFRGLHGRRSDFSLVNGSVASAYQTVLGGNAFYYQALICRADDYSMHEALVKELEYAPCWMSGGTPLYRPTALGTEEALKKSRTYEHIVRWLAGHFGVEPVRSLVNYYRDGEDYTSFHSDQYYSEVNMTIGASFGEDRTLLFEHRESGEQFSFPQHNGDVFAFTDEVNNQFMHAVPREKRRARSASCRHTPGRISVILWARRGQPTWKNAAQSMPIHLLALPQIVLHNPNAALGTQQLSSEGACSPGGEATGDESGHEPQAPPQSTAAAGTQPQPRRVSKTR